MRNGTCTGSSSSLGSSLSFRDRPEPAVLVVDDDDDSDDAEKRGGVRWQLALLIDPSTSGLVILLLQLPF